MTETTFWVSFALTAAAAVLLLRRELGIGIFFASLAAMYLNANYVLITATSNYAADIFPDVMTVSDDLLHEWWQFVQLSLLGIFIGLMWLTGKRRTRPQASAAPEGETATRQGRLLFFGIALMYAPFIWAAIAVVDISYDSGSYPWILTVAALIGSPLVLVQYVKARSRSWCTPAGIVHGALFLANFSGYVAMNLKGGTRASVISLLIALLVYEARLLDRLRPATRYRKYLQFGLPGLVAVVFLNVVNVMRQIDPGASPLDYVAMMLSVNAIDAFLGANFLFQTYSIPPVLLLSSMHNQFIDPVTVTISNVANSLVLLDYPYLSTIVSTITNPTVEANRRAGYAYSILVEGYNFMGFWGFAYNAVVFCLGVSLWRFILKTRDEQAGRIASALFVLPILSILFGQSALFVKMSYLSLIPGMLLYQWSVGKRVWTLFGSTRRRATEPLTQVQPV